MDVLADGPVELTNCGFPRDDSATSPTVPMRMFERKGTNGWFLALYRTTAQTDQGFEIAATPAASEAVDVAMRLSGAQCHHRLYRLRHY